MATIAENLQAIQDIKQNIKTAIENKGVDMTNTPFSEYSTKIDEISSGGIISDKIDAASYSLKFGNSTFTIVPDIFDFSNVTDMSDMFDGCQNLTTIHKLNTSNVTNMDSMFYYCKRLTSIELLDTSNVSDMSYMFRSCQSLTTIPQLNTSNVTNMSYMFYDCQKLTTIPQLDTAKVTNMSNMFQYCTSLQSLPLFDCGKVTDMYDFFYFDNMNNLTYLGGFKDLKVSPGSYFLNKAPNLTIESLMNVINNVYDLTANGLSGQSLKFGSTNLNKLTAEQIAVATAKGWRLTA